MSTARERLQAKLEKLLAEEFPNVVARVSPLELGPPVGWPVQYRVSGPDHRRSARASRSSVAEVDGGRQPDARASTSTGWSRRARCASKIDQDQARRLGLSPAALAAVLNTVDLRLGR